MNEHDPLDEVLAQFRETPPSEAVRNSNRAAVRRALEPVGTPRAWWRRTISLPVPVVLATAAALLISMAAHLLSAGNHSAGNNAGPSGPGRTVDPSAKGEDLGSLIAAAHSQVKYSESQRYLSGIGVIDRNVIYRLEE
jgi:hypothetical protein